MALPITKLLPNALLSLRSFYLFATLFKIQIYLYIFIYVYVQKMESLLLPAFPYSYELHIH